jgi:hypothetical protein
VKLAAVVCFLAVGEGAVRRGKKMGGWRGLGGGGEGGGGGKLSEDKWKKIIEIVEVMGKFAEVVDVLERLRGGG